MSSAGFRSCTVVVCVGELQLEGKGRCDARKARDHFTDERITAYKSHVDL